MSLAEFVACVDGWNRSQGAEDKPPPISDERYDAMLAEFGFAPE